MTEHLPECPKSGCAACYEQGQQDCALTHAIRGLEDMNGIQRWAVTIQTYTEKPHLRWDNNSFGDYVTYVDHVAAIAEVEQRVLDAAVQRVEALAVNPYYCEDQWYGAETHLVTSQVITAVKGDQQ